MRGIRTVSDQQPLLGACLAALLAYLVGLLLNTRQTLGDPDIYLHVTTGYWIWNHMTVSQVDIFSFSKAGQAWIAHEWLAQVLLARIHAMFGWYGTLVLTSLAFAVTSWIQFIALWRRMEPIQCVAFVLLSIVALSTHFVARPHVLAWPILALWTYVLVRANDENRAPHLGLLLLMLLWVNLHASFMLGLVVMIFIAADAMWRTPKMRMRWLWFMALSVVVCCINPYGWHTLMFPFQLKSMELLAEIGEWSRPVNALFSPVTVLLLLLVFYFLQRRLAVRWLWIPLLLALCYQGFMHLRYVSLAVLLVPFLLQAGVRSRRSLLTEREVATKHWMVGGSAMFLGMLLAITLLMPLLFSYAPASAITPKDALEHRLRVAMPGHVLNQYSYGGYLIYKGVPVFIDGRMDFYTDTHVSRYLEADRAINAEQFQQVLADYDIAWTLFQRDAMINTHLASLENWHLFYADDQAMIYVRNTEQSR